MFIFKNKNKEKKYKIRKMKISSIILIGYRNIFVNKFRSFLTIGGVAVGIGVVTFLICVGFGMQKMVIDEVTKNNPENIIDVNNSSLDNFVSLNRENVDKIKSIYGVEDVAVQVSTGGKFYFQESQTDVIIFGLTDNYLKLLNVQPRYGQIEGMSREGKVVISKKLANVLGLGEGEDVIGKRVNFDIIL